MMNTSTTAPQPKRRQPVNRFAVTIAAIFTLCLGACGDSLPPAEQRVVPALLPLEQREEWRRLPLENNDNFRDLGGYRTADGRRVRWGLLYRSDDLAELSEQDHHYLERLGIRRVVDFRSRAEQEQEPDHLPEGLTTSSRPMAMHYRGSNVFDLFHDVESLNSADTTAMMRGINRQMVSDYSDEYSGWLQRLADPGSSPQIFHCTGGKDRTGFAAAMLLLALGVPEETVMRDYMLSAEYYHAKLDSSGWLIRLATLFRLDMEKLRAVMTVRPDYLQAAFAEIRERHGSMEAYMQQTLGLSPQLRRQLQNRFLEPAL